MPGFVFPWLLVALVTLPLLWWFIRHLPPQPKKTTFPALALLRDLKDTAPPPRTPPWWLLLIRLGMIACFILAFAHPFLQNDRVDALKKTPTLLFVDNGWSSAPHWPAIQQHMLDVIRRAQGSNQPVLLVGTAENNAPVPLSATEARQRAQEMRPRPWPGNRMERLEQTAAFLGENAKTYNVVWLASGVVPSEASLTDLLATFGPLGRVQVSLPPADRGPVTLTDTEPTEGGLKVTARQSRSIDQGVSVSLYDLDGRLLSRGSGRFSRENNTTELTLPLAATAQGAGVLKVDGQIHLGAFLGLGQVRTIPRVGLIGKEETDFPLLTGAYYAENALANTTSPRKLDGRMPMEGFDLLLLNRMPGNVENLQSWVQNGGVLLTFAGPWLEDNRALDDLLPVRLRRQARQLSGPLSWTGALKPGSVNPNSPLKGLTPPQDVHVTTQFLPEDDPELAQKTWLRLEDGTPLLTARKDGAGWVLLMHVTADARWSSLPLSGFYVDLLERIMLLVQGEAEVTEDIYPLPPYKIAAADGSFQPTPASVRALKADSDVDARNPVGFYGTAAQAKAHNLPPRWRAPVVFDGRDLKGLPVTYYASSGPRTSWQPPLLILALLLLLADTAIRLWQQRSATVAAALLMLAATALPTAATAQDVPEAGYHTQIGWMPSGNPQVDTVVENGLGYLSELLTRRTTVDMAEPKKLNPETDELGYHPLIYWPVTNNLPKLGETSVGKLRTYINNGGMILMDSRTDVGTAPRITQLLLREILQVPLKPLKEDHVINRSYYLLRGQYPGRVTGQPVWIENTNRVAGLVVGSHDWAGAWAFGADGKPLRAVVPGGENQRAISLRFGINMVMYALLGTYKADQLHVDTLLERMGDRP